MRGRSFRTQSDIDRHIEKGFGQGSLEHYVPWLRVQDVPSHGRSRKIHGTKVNRLHHLLSDLEYGYLLLLEFSDRVIDIREQYPLLPQSSAQSIANALNISYPVYPGTKVPLVMTTDFLITLRQPDGSSRLVARTIKYSDSFDSGRGLKRTLEKLKIEREFWKSRDIDWTVVTEKNIPAILSSNLDWFRKGAALKRELQQRTLIVSFLDEVNSMREFQWPLERMLRSIANSLFIPYSDAKNIFMHLVWNKYITLNLVAERLTMKSVLIIANVLYPAEDYRYESRAS
ncbi:transposase [Pseudomonas sp. phDV1]|uniref:Transposase n=1 Tax=Ectopseudomonas oleovorans TaxID=301 RepID=A0A3R8VSN9_ECTOL|nr:MULTISPECIES: TnsA endonuclease N-terminal domain-containing protein [Pseudomonadaceae]AXO63738.1 transposase [Pseudomonas sp. phDV1]MDX2354823.1 TnsA endonuclease N-terminal domain-containing protein [Stutzerimonas xanthomarina]RRW28231.1 transposase [Pseudomonas oleovorans]